MRKINDKLRAICSKVFNIKESEVAENISKDNTPEWDSLNHLLLLTEIEKQFKFKFTASETVKIKSIKDIETVLKQKSL